MSKPRSYGPVFGLMLLINCLASSALAGIACTDSAFGVGPFAPSGYYLSSVTTNSGCELGSTVKDEPRPAAVEADTMFGTSQWNVFQTFSNVGATSGTWDLGADFFSEFGFAQIVFTSAVDANVFPATYVSYIIRFANGTSGTWTSPFNDGQNLVNVDEMTIYWAGIRAPTPSAVPIPAALPLMFTCLASLGMLGWRVRRHRSARRDGASEICPS